MRLLIDTDAFCKLGTANLLTDAVAMFGAELRECGRLPALPYMLRRGSLPHSYGKTTCTRLIPVAESMPGISEPSGPWLERLTPIRDIDPGEAILFAAAADVGLPVISGDLRALRALKDVKGFPDALTGRVVVLEALLIELHRGLGPESLRARLEPLLERDKVVGVCFSPENRHPEEGLQSYFQARTVELAPLVLWEPRKGETE